MNLSDRLKQFPDMNRLLKKIGAAKAARDREVYAVGGLIRDILLNAPGKDLDITVIGDGIEFARELADELGIKKIITFEKFGTALIPHGDMDIEVVTARTETYDRSSRKPEVSPSNLRNDLLRRDFTLNTIAMRIDPKGYGTVIDPLNGIRDIKKKIIRTPLDPAHTFSEDPLRILRAIRFATVLEFTMDPMINQAVRILKHRLSIVSQERITAEILKILMADTPSVGFILMKDLGILADLLPEIDAMSGLPQRKDYHHKDIFTHTLGVVDNVARVSGMPELRFAALVHDIAKPVTREFKPGVGWTFHGHDYVGIGMIERLGRRLKLPVKMIRYAQKITRLHLRPIALVSEDVTDSAIRRLLVEAGEEVDDLLSLCKADITSHNPSKVSQFRKNFERVMEKMVQVREKDRMRKFQSPVRGDEIMKECDLKPGPMVGYIKSRIEEAILDGIIPNTYDAAKDYLIENKNHWLNEGHKTDKRADDKKDRDR